MSFISGRRRLRREPCPETVVLTRYTWDAWYKVNKGKVESGEYTRRQLQEMWEERMCPGDVIAFIDNTLEAIEKSFRIEDLKSAKIVTVDDEYFTYLEEKGLEHSEETATKYAIETSEEDAFRLLKKNGEDKIIRAAALPVTLIHNGDGFGWRTYIRPGEDAIMKMKHFIEEFVEPAEVFIPRYAIAADALYDNQGSVQGIAESYFEEGVIPTIEWYAEQRHVSDDLNMITLFIPVYIRESLTSAVIDVEHMLVDENGNPNLIRLPNLIMFEERDKDLAQLAKLKQEEYNGIEFSWEKEFGKPLKESLENEDGSHEAYIMPVLISIDEIPSYMMDQYNALKKAAKKQKKNLDLR